MFVDLTYVVPYNTIVDCQHRIFLWRTDKIFLGTVVVNKTLMYWQARKFWLSSDTESVTVIFARLENTAAYMRNLRSNRKIASNIKSTCMCS